MYYRRKVLLSILEQFGGELNRTKLQKLTFLFTREQEKKAFDFVPYRYGCYSFQANQDLKTMCKKGLLHEETKGKKSGYWKMPEGNSFTHLLQPKDRSILRSFHRAFKSYSTDDLIRLTYTKYPYFAINSSVAAKYLEETELEAVDKERPKKQGSALFTIGYEGITLETYLNKLIEQNVRLLCDVRKNSLSMKFGFSKRQLKHACEQVGIDFHHLPDLGIESDKRKKLTTMRDYDLLFAEYEKTTLANNHQAVLQLADLVKKYDRVAITCFEASHCMCHRGRVVKALEALPDWDIPIKHL
jgi:uncharacterized protein YwgA